jgi:hypothetical protein
LTTILYLRVMFSNSLHKARDPKMSSKRHDCCGEYPKEEFLFYEKMKRKEEG